MFETAGQFSVSKWANSEYRNHLVQSAMEWLRERGVILPALMTLESLVRSVRSSVERGQTGPIGKNTTLSSRSLVALEGIWAERSEPAPPALSSLPMIGAGKSDVLPA